MGGLIFTIFDILNFGVVFLLFNITLKKYKILPQSIPIHFNLEGKPDHFGNKRFAFLFPILGLLLFVGFYFLNLVPEKANYPVDITEGNKNTQFFIGVLFSKWMLLLVLLLFINIQDYMFRYSFDENSRLRIPIWACLVPVFFSIITFIITSSLNK